MNYLAHLYLSGFHSEIRFGNFIGDAVKGNKYGEFPKTIQKGILLHRRIDTFTDQHILVKKAKALLSDKYGHYRGVIIDIFFDHFLSKNWTKYQTISLENFLLEVKTDFENFKHFLSLEKRQYYQLFLERDYLYDYHLFAGLKKTLEGLEKRIPHQIQLSDSLTDLKENYTTFEQYFFQFFEELRFFCDTFLKQEK